MQYRVLGTTGIKVSSLGFGCMRLPTVDGGTTRSAPVNTNAASSLIAQALDMGINYFDTAYMYHASTSEAALGQGLADAKARGNVLVATKLPPNVFDQPQNWQAIFEEQCAKLRTDYIDVYLAHAFTRDRWALFQKNGGLEFFSRLKKEGRIRALGFSFHDEAPVFLNILEAYNWDVCQIQYNYMDTELQAGQKGYEAAARRGIGVISMESLKGGSLAQSPPPDVQAIWDSTGKNYSPAEWALRWVLNHPNINVALSGMGNAQELQQNAKSALHQALSFTPADHQAIANVRAIFELHNKVPCTTCGYCMPCPSGVDIPGTFLTYNQHALFGDTLWAVLNYNMMSKQTGNRADSCTQCGLCLEKCPQHINIPEKLGEAHTFLDGLTI